jgi:uncharacterized protein DUF4388
MDKDTMDEQSVSNPDGKQSGAESLDPDVVPKPFESDAVEVALDLAETVTPGTSEHAPDSTGNDGSLPETSSLRDVIDQVERRLQSSLSSTNPIDRGVSEELDALDIETDLGRPDEESGSDFESWSPTQDDHDQSKSEQKHTDNDEITTKELRVRPSDPENLENSPDPADPSAEKEGSEVEAHHFSSAVPVDDSVISEVVEQPGLNFPDGDRCEGDLGTDPVWSLLVAALVGRVSGVLLLYHKGSERRFFIRQGLITITTSTKREDRLVELLYREGRLNETEYHEAVRMVGVSGRRVGAILVEKGFIASRELYQVVRYHYENIILDSFDWREGSWRFENSVEAGTERIQLEVMIPTLIVEGLRSRARPQDVDALVPLDAKPRQSTGAVCRFKDTGILPEEMAICKSCDGDKSVANLARDNNMLERDMRGLLSGLSVLGLLSIESDSLQSFQDYSSSQVANRRGTKYEFMEERANVEDKLSQVYEGTYFAILEISPEASGYEVRKAYRALSSRFKAERFVVRELLDLQENVELIRQVVDEAYEVLRHSTLREAYRQSGQHEL